MTFDASGPGRAAMWAILALSRARHAPERRLFFYYILCEASPSTELVIGDRCFRPCRGRSPSLYHSTPRGKWLFLDHFSGIRPLQTWNSVLKKAIGENRAIFPTRHRLFDGARFCLGTFPRFGIRSAMGGHRRDASKQQLSTK